MSSSLNSSGAANFDVGLHFYQLIMDYKIILILIFQNIPPPISPLFYLFSPHFSHNLSFISIYFSILGSIFPIS